VVDAGAVLEVEVAAATVVVVAGREADVVVTSSSAKTLVRRSCEM
jgi:hypothetical protein